MGDYLSEPDGRFTWSEHLKHVVFFLRDTCETAFDEKFPGPEAWAVIDLIWQADSKAEVLSLMGQAVRAWPETKSWFNGKCQDGILPAFTAEISKISVVPYMDAPQHAGMSESSHYADIEAVGRKNYRIMNNGYEYEMLDESIVLGLLSQPGPSSLPSLIPRQLIPAPSSVSSGPVLSTYLGHATSDCDPQVRTPMKRREFQTAIC